MSENVGSYAQTLVQIIDICNDRNLTPGQRVYEIRRLLAEAGP